MQKYTAHHWFAVYACWHLQFSALGGFLRRHFRALLARFGESDRDGLLSARHFAAFSTLAGAERAFFLATHGALHALARSLAVFRFRLFTG